MIRRRLARACVLAAAMSIASVSTAGVWGSQPVIGVSTDYSTNPGLLNEPNADTAETHAALLLDAPTSYVGDAFKFSVLPSFRFSDAQGYSLLDSDYEHLNARGEFDTDLDVVTLMAGVARDSSLYHDYLLSGSTGVERNSLLGDLNWDRKLTERIEIDTDVNWTRVRYGAGPSTDILGDILTDYKYTSLAPTLAWAESELGKLTLAASVGRYDSLNGLTESTSANLQAGFTRQLSEIWSVSATGGYSRANNRGDTDEFIGYEITPSGFVPVFIPVTLKSTQTGSVFSANVSRQTQLLLLAATASRQLAPTGFAFLSRQETYELKAGYTGSARWTFNGDLRRTNYEQPEGTGATTNSVNVTSLQLSAAWQWTEHWTVTVNATRILERYGSPTIGVDASGVSLELSRQFDWKTFQ
jgi:hypothetical protein